MLHTVRLCALCLTLLGPVLCLGGCPTPNPAADPGGDSDRVDAPVFSPAGCSFLDSMELSITCPTPGAAIRYTTDGSIPSDLVGTVYTGKITLTETTTVRAVAYADGLRASAVVSFTFTRTDRQQGTVSISDHTVAGTLITGQPCMFTVSCTVSAFNYAVESVSADLSEVGGLTVQPLVRNGARWGWSGLVLPTKSGPLNVRFLVNNQFQDPTDAVATVEVALPNVPPAIADAVVSGTLTQGDPCTISLSCSAGDSDGVVRNVTADSLRSAARPFSRSAARPGNGHGPARSPRRRLATFRSP